MDWLIGLSCVIVGAVVGFFVAKYLFEPRQAQAEGENQEKSEKQFLTEQANLHIAETQAALHNLQQQFNSINEQLNHYQQVIEETSREKSENQLEYYSQQASLHLKTKPKESGRNKAQTDYQPLDYSEGSSGLFVDTEKNQKHSETT